MKLDDLLYGVSVVTGVIALAGVGGAIDSCDPVNWLAFGALALTSAVFAFLGYKAKGGAR